MQVQLPNGTNPVTQNAQEAPQAPRLSVDQLRQAFSQIVAIEAALAAAKADAEAQISVVAKAIQDGHSTGPFLLPDGREVFIGNREGRYFLKVRSKQPKPITAL